MNLARGLFLTAACLGCGASSSSPGDASVDTPVATDLVAAADSPTTPDVPAMLDAARPTDVVDAAVTDARADASVSDGPLLPPYDAGPLLPDAGALGEPAWAPLDVRVTTPCTALVACGGAEAGTWDVSGGCIDLPVPSELMLCPGAMVTRAAGQARGRVTFSGGFARRAAQWEVEAEIVIPALCAQFAGGCAGIESTIRGALPEAACAANAAGDCRCAARQSGAIADNDLYTTERNQIVSAALGKRWDYCVDGGTLRYHDVSTSGTLEPGIIALTRRAP